MQAEFAEREFGGRGMACDTRHDEQFEKQLKETLVM